MTWLECIAVVLAFIAVCFQWREHPATWWLILLSSVLYVKIFYDSGLIWDAALQLIFISLALRGILSWRDTDRPAVAIHRCGRRCNVLAIGCASVGTALLASLSVYLRSVSLPVAVADGAIFSFSVLAVWLTERKVIESWNYWIAIDLLAAALYFSRELLLTSILYLLYVPLAVIGVREWKRRLHAVVSDPRPC